EVARSLSAFLSHHDRQNTLSVCARSTAAQSHWLAGEQPAMRKGSGGRVRFPKARALLPCLSLGFRHLPIDVPSEARGCSRATVLFCAWWRIYTGCSSLIASRMPDLDYFRSDAQVQLRLLS